MDSAADLLNHVKDLRATWQGRALEAARGRMMIAISSILAHSYDEAMAVLFRVVRPACWDDHNKSLRTPFLCGAGKINKAGQICADAILFDGAVKVSKVLFSSERDLEYEFRKLADRLRLSDNERMELFGAVKRWVVCDHRLDPHMDPKDPDAKRLTVN